MTAARRLQDRRAKGTQARLFGRRQEVLAAVLLMLKGYRILGFRLKTPQAEIDILAVKGPALAVIEVKSRATLEAALEAVSYDQRRRLRQAGRGVGSRRAGLKGLTVRLDLMAFAPGRLPRHIPNAWPGDLA